MYSGNDSSQSCAVCRFLRSFAFSTLGAAIVGYGVLGLGVSRDNAIIAAAMGALAAVVLTSRKKR